MHEEHKQPESTSGGFSQFLMILVFLVTIMVLIDPESRKAAGEAVGTVLGPIISFDGRFPLLTLFCASLIMVSLRSVLMHFFTDYVQTAKTQKIMKEFNKELRQARMAGNQLKVKKLLELQPQIMKYQSKIMMTQMKTMILTMLVAMSVFTWLFTFMEGLDYRFASLPWEAKWHLLDRAYLFPNWILLYSMMSIPLSQAFSRLLKLYEFRKEAGTR